MSRKQETRPASDDAPATVPSTRGEVLSSGQGHGETLESATCQMRIAQAMTLMRRGAFVKGKTVKRLAAEWGVSEDWASHHTAEASKRVRAEFDEFAKVEARDWCLRNAKRVATRSARLARKMGAEKGGADHARVALAAIDQVRQLTGCGAPTKLDVSGMGDGIKLPADPTERAKIYRALAEREEQLAGGSR